jgi:SAM-dependent methyltransferase
MWSLPVGRMPERTRFFFGAEGVVAKFCPKLQVELLNYRVLRVRATWISGDEEGLRSEGWADAYYDVAVEMLAAPVEVWRIALRYGLAMALALLLLYQVRKPSRWLGRPFLWMMNLSHSPLTDWGLQHVRVEKDFRILDVGCGGGRTIEKLAAMAPEGKVSGVDYATGSVAASRSRNRKLISAGRVSIELASVAKLPFEENSFDLVTAVETQYYWPNLQENMREILRVLKPGGTLLIVAESYKHGRTEALQRPVMKILRSATLGVEDQRELFAAAGFAEVQIFEEKSKGWICCAGNKKA